MMGDELFSISFILSQLASGFPLIVTLIVGAVICHRQRLRRPRAARLLGWAILAELIWHTVGGQAYFFMLYALGLVDSVSINQTGEIGWMVAAIMTALPSAMIQAAIWGSALWAVLMIDDWDVADNCEATDS